MHFKGVRFHAMGGSNEVQLFARTQRAASEALDRAIAEVRRLESKYSRYRPDSVVSRINGAAGGAAVEIDDETASLLDYADVCWRASDGLFDITSGVLRRVWRFAGENATSRLPDRSALDDCLRSVGWGRVRREPGRIQLEAGVELDFGGIGKEYAVDRACHVLQSRGVTSALVNLGGDTRVLGPRPAESGADPAWHIGVVHPRDPDKVLCTVALDRGALATSGDYERFVTIHDERYCHVLNPQTGLPVRHWQSVSVIAPVCLAAGSATTVAMLKEEGAVDFLRSQGISYLVVDQGGQVRHGGVFDRAEVRGPAPLDDRSHLRRFAYTRRRNAAR